MIIQIRGTSGSGKTWVMNKVLSRYLVIEQPTYEVRGHYTDLKLPCGPPRYSWTSIYKEGRKQPMYYVNHDERLAVLGHYNSACGGCDNVGSARAVYELIQEVQTEWPGYRIVCEGLLLSEDVKWSSQLKDLRVIFLTTPTPDCLTNIEHRRKLVGNDKPLNPKNTENRVGVIERARLKLTDYGVLCRRAPSQQAYKLIIQWLEEDRDAR